MDYEELQVEPVTEIAGDLGYQDVPAFSKAFRHWTGVSPRAYRKANGQSSSVFL